MRVNVKAFAGLRRILGRERFVDLEKGATARDLLDALCVEHRELRDALFDGQGLLKDDLNVIQNGRNISLSLETPLQDGDEVAVFPLAIGG